MNYGQPSSCRQRWKSWNSWNIFRMMKTCWIGWRRWQWRWKFFAAETSETTQIAWQWRDSWAGIINIIWRNEEKFHPVANSFSRDEMKVVSCAIKIPFLWRSQFSLKFTLLCSLMQRNLVIWLEIFSFNCHLFCILFGIKVLCWKLNDNNLMFDSCFEDEIHLQLSEKVFEGSRKVANSVCHEKHRK